LRGLLGDIGSLSKDKQLDIAPIIRSLDLTDSDSIQTAISFLEDMGPEYKNIITRLNWINSNLI